MSSDSDVLRRWGVLGRQYQYQEVPSWSPVTRIVVAAVRYLDLESREIAALLKESKSKLFPLDDPFAIDLGLHRWMKDDREEAYSDWLAWIISQLNCSIKIWSIFGLTYKGVPSEDIDVRRESRTTEGHEGRTGRIDLGIWLGAKRGLAVEIKLGNADQADTEKH